MSHSSERKEKICLNCNTTLYARFCHICGQENIEPKETVGGLITHFFYDITHFDGKFFSTLKYLLFKPGFLPAEYIRGRRASYLHPIRMYVFTSAFFFIIFFAMINETQIQDGDLTGITKDLPDRDTAARAQLKNILTKDDSVNIGKYFSPPGRDSVKDKKSRKTFFTVATTVFSTKASYDSAQKLLPAKDRDGWLERRKVYKQIEVQQRFRQNPEGMVNAWLDKFMHMFPQLLFVSLPAFALILKLLYLRKKRFYYADHAIFSIHLYIFAFISMLVYFLFVKLYESVRWKIFDYLTIATVWYMIFYTFLAMRHFYQESRLKTLGKYFLLFIMSAIVLIFLFIVFFVLSVFQI